MTNSLHIGLLINPLAGLGGALALKGSDGEAVRSQVEDLDTSRSRQRMARAFAPLHDLREQISITTWAGDMGASLAAELPFKHQVLGQSPAALTSAADTREAALALRDAGVDLLVFAGGDGTARDIYDAVNTSIPVLGLPAGVKMHSGVFAVSPEAAGELLVTLCQGGLVGLTQREVRDIDEEAFREGRVRTRFYGELAVPGEGRYLQQTKVAGRESIELVAQDIAAWYVEHMQAGYTYLVGPGSTTAAVMAELGLANTLLGVDAVRDGELIAADLNEAGLLALVKDAAAPCVILVTAIGGQGHVFGRGNQQFSPAVIRAVGLNRIDIVTAKSKITGLAGRPLIADTNDPALDAELSGYRKLISGYDDFVLYRIGTSSEELNDAG
ncbi:MAG: ATP-NAD kinase family protein [Pseudomonadota bacterium]